MPGLVTVQLACEHVTTIDVDELFNGTGDVQCWVCGYDRPWVSFNSMNEGYTIKCRQCIYTRAFKNARQSALIKASSHAIRKGHTIDVYLDGKHVSTSHAQVKGQQPLPNF